MTESLTCRHCDRPIKSLGDEGWGERWVEDDGRRGYRSNQMECPSPDSPQSPLGYGWHQPASKEPQS